METAPRSNEPQNKAPVANEIAKEWNLAQIQLALLAAEEAHPELTKDMVRKIAMQEWVGTMATRFSEYMEDPAHEHETCDFTDPAAVKNLLEKVRSYKTPDTLH